MTLNTYAASLPYFTLKKREKKQDTGHIVITFPRNVKLISAYIWVGYDQGSQFEACCKIWLMPRISLLYFLIRVIRDMLKRFIKRLPWYPLVSAFSGSVMLGGVYLHKHNTTQTAYQNDFYQLKQLRDIVNAKGPIAVLSGSQIAIDRDIFNIDTVKTFNAWDCEVVIVVDE